MADYRYKPLRDWQIRLLQLHSGSHTAPLRGELHIADLFPDVGAVLHAEEEQVEFEALSYAWGQPDFAASLDVGNGKIAISTQLSLALPAFRKPDSRCFVWADAICINQNDDAEKSRQIQKMFQIYRKASETMVYLRPASEHSNLAMAFLETEQQSDDNELSIEYAQNLFLGLQDLFDRA